MVASALNSHPQITCQGERMSKREWLMPDKESQFNGYIKTYWQGSPYAKKIIHLLRNPIDAAKSHAICNTRGKEAPIHYFKEHPPITEGYDPEEALQIAHTHCEYLRKYLQPKYSHFLNIWYEDIVQEGYDKILQYLGADIIPLSPITVQNKYVSPNHNTLSGD